MFNPSTSFKHTVITSKNNPWVMRWSRYQAKPHLAHTDTINGGIWLEGEHLVIEALQSNYLIKQLIVSDTEQGHDALNRCINYIHNKNNQTLYDIIVLSQSIYHALSTMDSVPSISAILDLSPIHQQTIDYNLATVVLDKVQDPGNVGTIIRLCAAFGIKQVLLSEGSCNPWTHKALRSGQAAQLTVSVIYGLDLTTVYPLFKRNQLPIITTALNHQAVSLSSNAVNPFIQPKTVWVFGNEGQGISETSQIYATHQVFIPMQGGFESLNVASAAAICLWTWQQTTALNT